jgi:hypothetical protein
MTSPPRSLFLLVLRTMAQSPCIGEEAVVIGPHDVLGYNEDNILPQHHDTILQIRTWLQPTDYDGRDSEYQKHLASHLPGTGIWFLDSDIYRKWHDGDEHGMLWARGNNTPKGVWQYDLTRLRHSRLGKICACCQYHLHFSS